MERSTGLSIGTLRLSGQQFCATLEPPWLQNAPYISCIPTGCYWAQKVVSPRFGETFEITDVPGRSKILFHAGNYVSNTHGCVLLGAHAGKLRQQRVVLNSGKTFKRFLESLKAASGFHIFIVDV